MNIQEWIEKREQHFRGVIHFPADFTPNLECQACLDFRIHNKREWNEFHKETGKGVDIRTTSPK